MLASFFITASLILKKTQWLEVSALFDLTEKRLYPLDPLRHATRPFVLVLIRGKQSREILPLCKKHLWSSAIDADSYLLDHQELGIIRLYKYGAY